jgi:hypothetical protein
MRKNGLYWARFTKKFIEDYECEDDEESKKVTVVQVDDGGVYVLGSDTTFDINDFDWFSEQPLLIPIF